MKLLLTTLLAILSFYVLVAVLVAVVVMFLGGGFETALKVGFLIPFKWMGWL